MSEVPATPPGDSPACRHRWRIAPPNGPISAGVCRLCGAERDFPTTTVDTVWDLHEGARPNPGRSNGSRHDDQSVEWGGGGAAAGLLT